MNDSEAYNLYLSLTPSEKRQFEALSPTQQLQQLRSRSRDQVRIDPQTAYQIELFFRELPDAYKQAVGRLSDVRRVERLFELRDFADRHDGQLPEI
ncbi:hypothetical protein [Laspinema olomoucense]|uniref:Uncharacterized protein n=1 Tax=Laspinema olomoucense D3b TaxID=2953688 RepID=A0ABT2NFS7_9CYAN|nr:hypothetical protein [Laspinema sp. D3b]MCT7981543.1 hypothetical protein [Laspinema sp. D3b]